MKIVLKRIEFSYFKGIHNLSVPLNEHVQSVFGANETGKSTIMNGVLWCWFGKDTEGRADYEIKTTDADGKILTNQGEAIDHSVTTWLDIDGSEIVAKRILKEKWVKPRGASKKEFAGNETEFYWNDVPCREKDFKEKVNGLIKEDVFKLLTNPLFFNDGLTGYKIPDWQARRNTLLEICGRVSDKEIVEDNPKFKTLVTELGRKTLEEYKKELASKRSKLVESRDKIPTRIDEVTNAIPQQLDFDALDREILAKEKEIADIDASLLNIADSAKAANEIKLGKQNKIYEHKTAIQRMENEIRAEYSEERSRREADIQAAKGQLRIKEAELTTANAELRTLESGKALKESKIVGLRTEWGQWDAKTPEPKKEDCKCSACGQDLPADTLAKKDEVYNTYVTGFNKEKESKQSAIREQGVILKTELDSLLITIAEKKADVANQERAIQDAKGHISNLETVHQHAEKTLADTISEKIAGLQAIVDTKQLILDIQKDLDEPQVGFDNSSVLSDKKIKTQELDVLKKQRNTSEQITASHQRIADLQKEEADLSDQLLAVEQTQFLIGEFERVQILSLEERINSKFKYARFKLFNTLVDGRQEPCCETMYKGVVWGSLNTAAKVLVGIDIINTMAAHYGVTAPIFLDNRESVTSIPDTDSQIINLIVSSEDKQLRVA